MRIAILASNYIRLPPEVGYVPEGASGAPEEIMYVITEELVKRNHEVYLFASGDSKTNAHLIATTEISLALDKSLITKEQNVELEMTLIAECYKMAHNKSFDIIHSIFDTRSAFFSQLIPSVPTISTLHSPISPFKKSILNHYKNTQYYVPISDTQKKSFPELQYTRTIYHGISLDKFTFNQEGGELILFLGRIAPEKGVHEVAVVSQKLKKKALIQGSHSPKNKEYWEQNVLPLIEANKDMISYGGLIEKKEINERYQKAKMFLFPLQWEEPFGLVVVESMACGTPVVAYARGAMPEIIKDGETGFLVNPSDDDIRGDFIIKKTGIEGLCEAVQRIYAMPSEQYKEMRKGCRKHVEEKFTVERMVDEYEKLYQEILNK